MGVKERTDTHPRGETGAVCPRAATDIDEEPSLAASAPSPSVVISASPPPRMQPPQPHAGFMDKYSVGKSFFSFGNWKKRYFTLNDEGLTYREKPDSKPLGFIPVGNYNTRLVPNP